jgi:hypothetical protein
MAGELALMKYIGRKFGDHEGSGNKSSKWAMYIGGVVVLVLGVLGYFYAMGVCPDLMNMTSEECHGFKPFLVSILPGLFILVLAVFFHIDYNLKKKAGKK